MSGIPDGVPDRQGFFQRVRDPGARDVEAGLQHRLLETAAVLGAMDRFQRCPDQVDTEPVEVSRFRQRHRYVETGLASQRRQERIGTFAFQDRAAPTQG